MIINSLQNEKIKNLIKLREYSKERKQRKLFLIEGSREIGLALAGGFKIENIFYCADYGKRLPGLAVEKIIEVSKKVFKKISYRENPDGLLALVKAREIKLDEIKLNFTPLIIILEAVEKPGNLGAILRTADAVGIDAVIINDIKTDIYNPNIIRASQGTVFTVPTVVASCQESLAWCKKGGIKILATSPEAILDYVKADFKKPCAIVLGTEDKGLSREWLDAADERIKINMSGKIDSLNVSVSVAVILFEAARQRENK